ncbi:hypothetical protein [Chelativorans sp. AA-79]|uniref:hypothetical protein n=1 Tax=Chelativorans sp. AA-79 TaxID=3028735 RepID=UPI0023F63333|nr:hypothetical protein [Chelativorans sp. AA-79]WEX08332.1 hypothetical protein PVE73_19965 [Chelativorans sp. AA-79]
MDRRHRLAKLLILQQRIKGLHEARHAAGLKQAADAQEEAKTLMESLAAPDSVSSLFPGLWHERIGRAFARRDAHQEEARAEMEKVAAASARADIVKRAHRTAQQRHERNAEERAVLEIIERMPKPDGSQ